MKLTVFLLIAVGFIAVQAQALPVQGSDKPVEITANNLEVIQKEKKAIFSGNVIAIQPPMTLKADRMIVHYKQGDSAGSSAPGLGGAVQRIDVKGNVLLLTAKETAKSSEGTYDVDRKKVTLTGNVVLTRDKNVLKGSQLNYDLTSGESILSSAGSGNGRVRGLFVPEKSQSGN